MERVDAPASPEPHTDASSSLAFSVYAHLRQFLESESGFELLPELGYGAFDGLGLQNLPLQTSKKLFLGATVSVNS